MKTALITGALGQDGSYLTEHLLSLGYKVFGTVRRPPQSAQTPERMSWAQAVMAKGVEFIYCDVRDEISVHEAVRKAWPDEIYNLAGQVYVPLSWTKPAETFDINVGGLARILDVVEKVKQDIRVYQASSSEMMGNQPSVCTERTELRPESPYGVSKVAAHKLVGLYRDRELYVAAGILFNHESPRRGHEMVTRKIARYVAGWKAGQKRILFLGNMEARRDWGFAGDYVKAMQLMLQAEMADDYVIGTGVSTSVAEFLALCLKEAELEEGYYLEKYVASDQRLVRKNEIFNMRADYSHAKATLGWKPKTTLTELVSMMVKAEYDKIKGGKNERYLTAR